MNAPICLITPPAAFLLDSRVFVTLGILRVAAVLEQAGHVVEHLDLSGVENYEDAVRAHAATSQAAIYGLTATTPQMPDVKRVVAALRDARPDARLILGGPHVTLVNAAYRREVKLEKPGRATVALGKLSAMFDVLVAGDGEDAIFHAIMPDAPKLIDGDSVESQLFLTNERYDELPLPARHLIDMDSYHYGIDGERAYSLIGQLGCLAAGTLITMADGRFVPIEWVVRGDRVISFDDVRKSFIIGPVEDAYEREAEDLWEIVANNNMLLHVTSEHPILTPKGWKHVAELQVGDEIAAAPCHHHLYSMLDSVRGNAGACPDCEVLQEGLHGPVPAGERQPEVAAVRSACDEGEVGSHDAAGARGVFEHRKAKDCGGNPSVPQNHIRLEEGRPQSDEALGGGGEGFEDGQAQMVGVSLREDEEAMARRANAFERGGDETGAEQAGSDVGRGAFEARSNIPIRGQQGILDRAVRVGEVQKSGLHRPNFEAGHPSTRGVLAHGTGRSDGPIGLPFEGVAGSNHLVQGAADAQPLTTASKASGIQFERIDSKRLIGASTVYNLTVCPGHSYIANGVIVHNCPFQCGFCGGRESAMLRRIRTRSVANIVGEVEHLYHRYGVKGFMFYDDELNVSKSMVPMMDAIADLQKRLGVEFRLRGFIKSHIFTDEQAAAMYRAGFRWILVGFESGSPRILDNIKKMATREQNSRCMTIARNHGLKVKALMSVGHPGESAETIAQTKDWLLEEKPADFDCTIISTYAGTPYFDHAEETAPGIWTYTAKNGDRLHSYEVDYNEVADYYKGSPDDGYRSYVYTDYLSAEQIVALRDDLERDVRAQLSIPFNPGAPGVRFETSMGQFARLPSNILRVTKPVGRKSLRWESGADGLVRV